MNQKESRAWYEANAHKYTKREIMKILNRSLDSVSSSLRYYNLKAKEETKESLKSGSYKPDLTRNPNKVKIRNDHKGKRLVSIDYKGIYTYVPVDATREEIEARKHQQREYFMKHDQVNHGIVK